MVTDRNQHRGIGTLLFMALVRELARRGIGRMRIEALASNADMLGIVTASGLPHTEERCDDIVVATVTVPT